MISAEHFIRHKLSFSLSEHFLLSVHTQAHINTRHSYRNRELLSVLKTGQDQQHFGRIQFTLPMLFVSACLCVSRSFEHTHRQSASFPGPHTPLLLVRSSSVSHPVVQHDHGMASCHGCKSLQTSLLVLLLTSAFIY